MALNWGFIALNETTVIVLVLSIFVFIFYKQMKKFQRRLEHSQIAHEMSELRNSAAHASGHRPHQIQVAGRINARPLVMAAIQEAKTEVSEHFAKRKFRNTTQTKEISAS